jgi:hypothetical protein
MVLIKVCLDHLNEIVGKRKGYSWDVGVQDLRKFFKRPISRSQLENQCGNWEYIKDTNPEAIVFRAIICDKVIAGSRALCPYLLRGQLTVKMI